MVEHDSNVKFYKKRCVKNITVKNKKMYLKMEKNLD